jgi:hypothetical protein
MATYASYKKLNSDQFTNSSVDAQDFSSGLNSAYGVQWFYGNPDQCSSGCCCLWTVPSGVKKIHIQAWGAGGNGAGSCNCGRCHHWMGTGGGYYNTKTITVSPGWTYTVCAGGVYPCFSRECSACEGCASYVNGCNLSNFCAIGGMFGYANTSWTETCNSQPYCCLGPGERGGDWLQTTHAATWSASEFVYDRGFCHCFTQSLYAQGGALIGTNVTMSLRECWVRCGCWRAPYANGAQSAMTLYCGSSCCGQGGTGGPGLVKITYF